jgi:mono/diheme cytochrome c family protein
VTSRIRAALHAGIVAVTLASACGAGPAARREAGSALPCSTRSGLGSSRASTLLLEGARVFDERCTPCHGETGHGDGVLADLLPVRPRNYHADRFEWGMSWEDIEHTVRVGRSDVMPSFSSALTDTEIRAVSFLVACWVSERDDVTGLEPR